MRADGAKSHWQAMAALASAIGGGFFWSPPTAQACTVTTTAETPTGLSATVNPAGGDRGILVEWTLAEPETVYEYRYYRGVGMGSTLKHWGTGTAVSAYNSITGTYTALPVLPTSVMDFESSPGGPIAGQTYVYAIVAVRRDNCSNPQESAQSGSVEVTYSE